MVLRTKEIGVRKCYGATAFNIHSLLAREAFVHLLLSLVLAAAIIFASVLGLVGFVRDESNRRSKEMAIRKINGATARDVLRIFAWDVLKLSLVMAVLASIGAFFVAHRWLEQFAERIGLSPFYFIAGAVAVLLIVTMVVVLCSNRIARMNPVKSLKNN